MIWDCLRKANFKVSLLTSIMKSVQRYYLALGGYCGWPWLDATPPHCPALKQNHSISENSKRARITNSFTVAAQLTSYVLTKQMYCSNKNVGSHWYTAPKYLKVLKRFTIAMAVFRNGTRLSVEEAHELRQGSNNPYFIVLSVTTTSSRVHIHGVSRTYSKDSLHLHNYSFNLCDFLSIF